MNNGCHSITWSSPYHWHLVERGFESFFFFFVGNDSRMVCSFQLYSFVANNIYIQESPSLGCLILFKQRQCAAFWQQQSWTTGHYCGIKNLENFSHDFFRHDQGHPFTSWLTDISVDHFLHCYPTLSSLLSVCLVYYQLAAVVSRQWTNGCVCVFM